MASKLDEKSGKAPPAPFGRFYGGLARLTGKGNAAARFRRTLLGTVEGISARLHEIAAERASEIELHATELQILILLELGSADHVLKAAEIQRALGFTAGGVTRRLDTMAAKGLVERIPDPGDGRAWQVRMTESGGDKIRPSLARNAERNKRIENEFSDDEREILLALLGRLAAALDSKS
jgi:DNA-binding MarR family transcriptional regulator